MEKMSLKPTKEEMTRKKVRVQYGIPMPEKDLNKGGVSSHAKTDMGPKKSKQKDDF